MILKRRHIDLRVGETIAIGDVTVTLEEKSGQRAKLLVAAQDCVSIKQLGKVKPQDQEVAA